jgi:DNA-binding transcriptional ArsR family regulator
MLKQSPKFQLDDLSEKAAHVAGILKELANEKRLLILCTLLAQGESSVASLADAVELGQSALSQHLARLRESGLVSFRRDGAMLHYRVADARVGPVLKAIRNQYCQE